MIARGQPGESGLDGDQAEVDGTFEVQKPSVPSKVQEPTAAERQEHYDSGHARYRSWCAHCTAAKGQSNPHGRLHKRGELP